MKKGFYITTTLPYVNAKPHIGFALEIVQADVLARYHRLKGEEVFFNTGTDEHGIKIFRRALAEKKDPREFVDEYAQKFKNLKEALNLSYNNFIRTTDEKHIRAATEFWWRCLKKGDIYKGKQKIRYCVGCEMAKTKSELVDGHCPLHPDRKLEIIEEENYFFRFSRYQKPLLHLYEKNQNFLIPQHRLKEIKNFVSTGLRDFSISRLKKKLPWGITVPNDPNHVMYVWFDALINYISAIGWPSEREKFEKWWPAVQVAGKDNLRQQAGMWQAMLLSAGLSPSKQIFIHGFITAEGKKIGKSLGNIIDPFVLVKRYGVDAVRYYLLREIPPTRDGDFSLARFKELYNADLANDLGNLIQRVAKLCERVKFDRPFTPADVWKKKTLLSKHLDAYQFNDALAYIWEKIKMLDQKINKSKPWEKKGKELEKILAELVRGLLEIASSLKPFLPETGERIEKIFTVGKIKAGKPLFPRI